jgi:hypothetical protein
MMKIQSVFILAAMVPCWAAGLKIESLPTTFI